MSNEDPVLLRAIDAYVALQNEVQRQSAQFLQFSQERSKGQAVAKTEPPTEEEKEILELFTDGSVLTGAQIAKMMGMDADNGTLRSRLSAMVKKGILLNKRPGYTLNE